MFYGCFSGIPPSVLCRHTPSRKGEKMLSDYEIVGESNGYKHVAIVAHIRKNETGEIRLYKDYLLFEEGESDPSVFNWEENNYSCDCNRYLFFQRAANEEEVDGEDICGEERYRVNLYNPKNGKCIYREFEEG